MFVMKRFISILLSMFVFVSGCIVTLPVSAADVDDGLADSSRIWDSHEGKVYDVHEGFLRIGDVDLDGWVTVMDATYIQRYIAGLHPAPYADCTGIYCGSDKEDIAKEAYDFIKNKLFWHTPVFDSKEVTDEALAAFLAILDPAINSDTDDGYYHTSRLAILSCFNQFPAPDVGANNTGDTIYHMSREHLDLFVCVRWLSGDFNLNSDVWRENFSGYENHIGPSRFKRAANYYFELIQKWK